MRILLIYPGHGFSTIDVARGYEAALRELGHKVRAYNYHNSLVFYQSALEFWAKRNKHFQYDDSDWLRLSSEMVTLEAIRFVPDVVLIVCGFALHKSAFDLLAVNLALPLVIILTESPYLDKDQRDLCDKANIGLAFTNERKSVRYLSGAVPTVYLPHSYDPERHKPRSRRGEPMQIDGHYQSDVFFCGTMYEERQQLFDAVNWEGIDSHIVGPVIGNREITGGMSNTELVKYYNATKIALNMHRTTVGCFDERIRHIEDGTAWSIGPRAYEIAGCGAFQICDASRGELQEVFGNTVPTFRDGEEMERLMRTYLADEVARLELAQEQRERVKPCSFLARARDILVPTIEGGI